MIQTVDRGSFHDAFKAMRPDNFTHGALNALFDYLEEYEEDTGTPVELDVIAICCEYSEYKDLAEFQADYSKDEYPTIESINDSTTVIEIDGTTCDDRSFIVQAF